MLTGRALGQALEAALRVAKISRSELISHFNVSHTTVSVWVNTGKIPDAKAAKLKDFFEGLVPDDHWEPSSEIEELVPPPDSLPNDTSMETLKGRALGRALEAAMRAKRLSRREFAHKLEVSPTTVHVWEKGKIPQRRLLQLMEFFSDVVGKRHWGLDVIDEYEPCLNGLVKLLQKGLREGRLNNSDIHALSSMASHLATRKTVA